MNPTICSVICKTDASCPGQYPAGLCVHFVEPQESEERCALSRTLQPRQPVCHRAIITSMHLPSIITEAGQRIMITRFLSAEGIYADFPAIQDRAERPGHYSELWYHAGGVGSLPL